MEYQRKIAKTKPPTFFAKRIYQKLLEGSKLCHLLEENLLQLVEC
jgi:hypothetical protein